MRPENVTSFPGLLEMKPLRMMLRTTSWQLRLKSEVHKYTEGIRRPLSESNHLVCYLITVGVFSYTPDRVIHIVATYTLCAHTVSMRCTNIISYMLCSAMLATSSYYNVLYIANSCTSVHGKVFHDVPSIVAIASALEKPLLFRYRISNKLLTPV